LECPGSERVQREPTASMVESERGEGEAIALTGGGGGGQLQQDGAVSGAAEGERDGEEGDAEDGEREEEEGRDDVDGWSEIRLAIDELSPARLIKHRGRGGDGDDDKPAAPSPPTLPFLALSHLLLRVLGECRLLLILAWKSESSSPPSWFHSHAACSPQSFHARAS